MNGAKDLERFGGPTADDAAAPAWLQELRQDSRKRFVSQGLPAPGDEEWRNTNLAPLREHNFHLAATATTTTEADWPALARLDLGGPRFVFVDGRLDVEKSRSAKLPGGAFAGALRDAIAGHEEALRAHLADGARTPMGTFADLNGAFLDQGVAVIVPEGVTLDRPIQIVHLGEMAETVTHPRTLVVAGATSRASVIEIFAGTTDVPRLTNAYCSIEVGAGAALTHARIQDEGPGTFHVSTLLMSQGRDSRIDSCVIDLGGRLVRNEIRSILAGEGGYSNLTGLYLTRGKQHVDNHTTLDHAMPNCGSRELFKGILDGRSRTVFRGRIIVREDAQKTDAKQSNPNLLLSNEALAHTKPQLEIYADDVKCTHGATMGRMDRDAVFYLRSRGIPAQEAHNLLVRAFAGEVTESIEPAALRDAIEAAVAERLPGAGN